MYTMRRIIFFAIAGLAFTFSSCSDFLDVDPKDRITGSALFDSDEGINSYMASLYGNLPIEDFRFFFGEEGFNFSGNSGGLLNATSTKDAIHSEWGAHFGETQHFRYWDAAYTYIRNINDLMNDIPIMKPSNPDMLVSIKGEAHFMKAYTYYQLAKRYGGVPIIHQTQAYNPDFNQLKVPRSTEVETWKYMLSQCDSAAIYLPDVNGKRATKWAALALKSRAALHAASIGKFWNKAPFVGEAVEKKLVGGMTEDDVKFFYQECINASGKIMESGRFELYKPEPESPKDATLNYYQIFADAGSASSEIIFSKAYCFPGVAHSMGTWHQPNQVSKQYGGRACLTLDLVEAYEKMDDNGIGSGHDVTTKLDTRTNGNENYNGFDVAANFKKYDDVQAVFAGRDPRLYATVLLPGDVWKKVKIVIQGGLVRTDGSVIWKSNDEYDFNGVKYYGKGASSDAGYSGWVQKLSNGTITGFLLKKYLTEGDDQIQNQVTTTYPDLRYAEILLNYAEAVVESGLPSLNIMDAKTALNKTRHRAGFKNDLELTPENVQAERRVEMAVENTTVWDYQRRREFHLIFDGTYQRSALVPMLDFTVNPAKYIFVREIMAEPGGAKRIDPRAYYRPIPGLASNSLVQNPLY